jgi:hypothetical protein
MFIRRHLDAPLGWDNTTEQTANVVDAVQYLARLFFNANSEKPDRDPLPRVPRPYEAQTKQEAPGVSLAEFANIIKE